MGKKWKRAVLILLLGLLALPRRQEPEETVLPSPYTLREYEGCVAVYCGGEEAPSTVTDIEVRLLPSRDREMLDTGLSAEDLQELSRLLEDLGS